MECQTLLRYVWENSRGFPLIKKASRWIQAILGGIRAENSVGIYEKLHR